MFAAPKGTIKNAQVAELVDALVSKTNGSNTVPVRFRPWVLFLKKITALKTNI